jgi:hypothetical protein
MQGRGSVMGDHNWDLSTGAWRALEIGLTESGVRTIVDADDEKRSADVDARRSMDMRLTDALWDRGALF